MFLTRIGFGSQAVITGDVTQVDVRGGRSGLLGLEKTLSGIDGLKFVKFSSRDVVRHKIVADGLQILVNLEHRGAVGADPKAGDGCGMLIQLPHKLFADEAKANGFELPEPGKYGGKAWY